MSVCAAEHLAQVQVCQSLAQCYLRLRKCRKAVELYKEALVALSHCQVGSNPEANQSSAGQM